MKVRHDKDSFGVSGYTFTLPDGTEVFLTLIQVEQLKEEIAEYA